MFFKNIHKLLTKRIKKPLWIVVFTLCSAAWITSCSIHETPPGSTQFNVSNNDLSCMDSISAISSDYFAGRATEAATNQVWDCSSHALDVFTQKVKGATPGIYRNVELRGFFQRYYIHKVNLTDALMNATGDLKQILVGGTNTQVTAVEITKIQAIFETLRSVSLSLRPYMPIATTGIQNKPWSELSEDEIDAFSAALNRAATQVGQVFESIGDTYTFDQFRQLIDAIQGSLPSGEDAGSRLSINSIRDHLELVQHAKALFVSPELDVIGAKGRWRTLWSTSGALASMLVKARWLMDTDRLNLDKDIHFPDETLTRGRNLRVISTLFNQFTGLMKQSVSRHNNQIILFDELVSILNLVSDSDLPASKASIISMITPRAGQSYSLVSRVVGGNDFSSDGRAAKGLTSGFLDHVNAAFANWYEAQRFLEALYLTIGNSQSNLGGDLLQSTIFQSGPALKLWQEVYTQSSPEWNKTTLLAAKRTEAGIREIRPLYYLSSSSEVSFPVDNPREAYSFHDLSQVNWMQTAATLVVQGYMDYDPKNPPERAESEDSIGISADEFQNFFNDLKPFGIEIKLFDPIDPNSAPSRFRELDVFTYASNGDNYMSVDEAVEYVAFSFSASARAAINHADISARCQADSAADPNHVILVKVKGDAYGEDLIEPNCYRKYFFPNYQTYWNPMTTAQKFYGGISSAERYSYNYLLETAARKYGYSNTIWVDSSDSQSFIAVLQYIEATFSRYDDKRTGFITEEEAKVALPVFTGVLKKIAAAETPPTILSDTEAGWVFNYMLAHGNVPDTAHHKIKAEIGLLWQALKDKFPILGSYEADRLKLLDIMGALSSASTVPASAATPSPSPSAYPSPSASPSASSTPLPLPSFSPLPSPQPSGI
jgi:hypothetical protein